MTIGDYSGISGFTVDIDCYEDLCEALDRMHSQVCDHLEEIEKAYELNPELKNCGCKEDFELMARVLEEAMEKL
jgi:Cdc6-like AAA superfamily ATPase